MASMLLLAAACSGPAAATRASWEWSPKVSSQNPRTPTASRSSPVVSTSPFYVGNVYSNSLTLIDPRRGRVVRTISVPDPYNLYFSPDGKRIEPPPGGKGPVGVTVESGICDEPAASHRQGSVVDSRRCYKELWRSPPAPG